MANVLTETRSSVSDLEFAPYGWDTWTHTETIPKSAPVQWGWYIGPIVPKQHGTTIPGPSWVSDYEREITLQLTADQQVGLSISGQDRYGNPVDIDASMAVWESTDTAIIQLVEAEGDSATAVAVGPVGTAVVTVRNPEDTVRGAIAFDVVAGEVTEVVVDAGEPEEKPYVEHRGR
jgi:hypothetical protein